MWWKRPTRGCSTPASVSRKTTWRIELWGKNLLDEDAPDLANQSFDYDTFSNSAITIGLPKKPTYGVRMNYEF